MIRTHRSLFRDDPDRIATKKIRSIWMAEMRTRRGVLRLCVVAAACARGAELGGWCACFPESGAAWGCDASSALPVDAREVSDPRLVKRDERRAAKRARGPVRFVVAMMGARVGSKMVESMLRSRAANGADDVDVRGERNCGIPTDSRYLRRECSGTNFWKVSFQSSRTREARTNCPSIVGNEFDSTSGARFLKNSWGDQYKSSDHRRAERGAHGRELPERDRRRQARGVL